MDIWNAFVLCFIPFFVAMDPIGLLPMFLSLTDGQSEDERRREIVRACLTGFLVAFGFMLLGETTFRILGVTIADFLVAGGIILFIFSLIDLIQPTHERRRPPGGTIGAVPLGTPLMVGPGVLATTLLLVAAHPRWIVVLALVANIVFAGLIYALGARIVRYLHEAGVRAISRIAALVLAAFAVMMVRRGIAMMLAALAAANDNQP